MGYPSGEEETELPAASHRSSSRGHHTKSSRRNSTPKVRRTQVWTWCCHNCREQASMTLFIDACPQCDHKRCLDCIVESSRCGAVAVRASDSSTSTSRTEKVAQILTLAHATRSTSASTPRRSEGEAKTQERQFDVQHHKIPDTLKSSSRSEEQSAIVSDSNNTKDKTRFSSPQFPAPGVSALGHESNIDESVPQRAPVVSPYSVPTSTEPSDSFSPREDSESSASEIDSDYFESGSEDESDQGGISDVEVGQETRELRSLESYLLAVLGYNLTLGSRLIPWIRAQVSLRAPTWDLTYIAAPSNETARSDTGNPDTHLTHEDLSARGNQSRPSRPHKPKRDRESDEDENEEGGERGGSKKPRTSDDETPVKPPLFACHYYKKDPQKYGAQAGRRYKSCTGPGPGYTLHRLKQHLKDHHRLWQCESCAVCFQNKHEFESHEQSESRCRAQASVEDHQLPHHERINKSQWKEIEVLLKAERGLTGIPKAKSESEKWFKTWDVLFAGAARPFHPYFEKIQVQSMRLDNLPPNQDSISAALQTLIDDEINQGAVPINSEFQQRYMNALRRAFELGTVVSISRQNPGLSLPALNESANISTHTDFSNIVASALPNETISTQLTGNEQQEHDSNTGHLLEESPSFDNEMSFGNHTPSFQTLQASASQSSMTPNVFDSPQYNDILQGASAMDRSSLLPRSTPDFGVPFAQPNLSEGTASLDLAHHPEPDDFFGIDFDPDFIDLTSFHMTQDETPVLPADEMHLGASEYDVNAPLGGGSLMAYLELEGESPAAMAEWKDNKDRNMGLSRP